MLFSAEKVVVIGLDAALTKSILKYSEKGSIPNMARLIKNGVWAENCLVPHPTITPPNWTTIATGAWPGTHGITCMHLHKSGWPLDYTPFAFSSLDCKAEYIWQAAERSGKRTILLNYPSTWPAKGVNMIQIGGGGIWLNTWRVNRDGSLYNPPPHMYATSQLYTVADEQLISTEELPFADVVELREARGWEGLSKGRHLESEIRLGYRTTYDKVKPVTGFILVHDEEGEGYDRVSFALEKNVTNSLFTLKEGEWSERQSLAFETDKGKKNSLFKAKLIELSPDGKKMRLYFTPFCQLDGWSYPAEIARELENLEGLPGKNRFGAHLLGWVDSETWLEIMREENTWLGEAAAYLLRNHDWALFLMHAHSPDSFYHAALNKIDPLVCKDEALIEEYSRIEEEMYISLDEMVGKILDAVDEKTLVFITSDHGATPTQGRFEDGFRGFSVRNLLCKAGLLAYKTDGKTGEQVIDWSKTKAVPQRSCYIYVNLKGRDPDGIVEPEDYEGVRDEIISVLYNYTDLKTGKKPIVFALRREDARILGLHGDRIGDVVYAIRAEAPGEHGRQLTTGEYGLGSMKGLLIVAGPNIKKGYVLKRTVWLTDIVPTICYLTGLALPKDVEGAVIYQAIENPDYLSEELKRTRRNYDRLRAAVEVAKLQNHEYE